MSSADPMRPGKDAARAGGRDYRTLLEMGWTPDSVTEAVEIVADLLRAGDVDAALSAVERAREIGGSGLPDTSELAVLEALAFEVALRRGDAPRAIAAANAIRLGPAALSAGELDRLRRELDACDGFRAELREALRGVLDAVPPISGAVEVERDVDVEAAQPYSAGIIEAADDELPYLYADPDALPGAWSDGPAGDEAPEILAGGDEWLDLPPAPVVEGDTWAFGAFPVGDGESLGDVRSRFMEAVAHAAPDDARQTCETGWSFFLMEDFEAAAELFDRSLGDPEVRVAAAEGLVRCRLNLAQPGEAVAFLDRLGALCFADGLPEPLRYWYGRAAEAGGEVRKARIAYASVSPGAFPDVPARLAALP